MWLQVSVLGVPGVEPHFGLYSLATSPLVSYPTTGGQDMNICILDLKYILNEINFLNRAPVSTY